MAAVWSMVAILTGLLAVACYYLALGLRPKGRIAGFVGLGTVMLLAPWIIPPEARLARLLVSFVVVDWLLKMWDLHVGAYRAPRLARREYFGFMANVVFLVHRRQGLGRQPRAGSNLKDLVSGLVAGVAGLLGLILLGRFEWSSVPFLIEHVLKATAFFVFATGFFIMAVALTRVAGAYSLDPVRRPLLAGSPADFWRRYNRCIGQFLREDVFRPLGGRAPSGARHDGGIPGLWNRA